MIQDVLAVFDHETVVQGFCVRTLLVHVEMLWRKLALKFLVESVTKHKNAQLFFTRTLGVAVEWKMREI